MRLSNQGDAYIQIRISRNVSVAVVVSLLVHALLLFWVSRQDLLNQQQPAAEQQTMVVRLTPKSSQQERAAPPPDAPQPPSPERQVRKTKASRPEAPRVMAVTRSAQTAMPSRATPRTPAPAKPATPDPAQFPDMMAYVNAAREKRHLAGEDADRINEEAVARERGPSPDEARAANITRNLQPSGTNGVFQILRMDAHTAVFDFRGWKNEYSASHREVYEVAAGPDGDVRRAMVRKMIEIIRRYYSGDFNWDSQRLGRVIVLSARPQDNDGLEDVLQQEFFGTQGIPAR